MYINADDYIDRIKKNVSKIMFENPELFPIVEGIFVIAKNYSIEKNDIEFYIRQTIESRIGLDYIVKNKINSMNEIIYATKTELFQEFEKATIKSILIEYMPPYPNYELFNKFNSIQI